MIQFLLSTIVWLYAYHDVMACGVRPPVFNVNHSIGYTNVTLIGTDKQLECAEHVILEENKKH